MWGKAVEQGAMAMIRQAAFISDLKPIGLASESEMQ
jgi:hypothetical protein